ncbi:MAG TPA: hypothetical protein DCG53_08000 [Syntrophus sp. (in: bacteria)]|nr:hypothetical protein [Syntrophus sp. (in: bacteria)]
MRVWATKTPCYLFLAFLLLFFTPPASWGKSSVERHFAGTDHELTVYRVQGKAPGKTIMIIGGIQGDEPGGFLSADLYADMNLKQGNLIVVPRANWYSIILNRREVNGDMNRKFADSTSTSYEDQIVGILKKLIAQSDCLLNLHDGSGFYSEKWRSFMRNPRRFGQSIIADTDQYRHVKTGDVVSLEGMAKRAIREINAHIANPEHHFHFNNHRTASQATRHPEQRRSATYYALFTCGIPAFGIETSKSLPLETRIYHHNLGVNAFMNIFDIKPDVPGINLPMPAMKYLVIKVNDQLPVVLSSQDQLTVRSGDTIKIDHIEANYERGLSADIEGYGKINDLHNPVVIGRATQITVRKDNYVCGRVPIRIAATDSPGRQATADKPHITYFRLKVNGEEKFLPNGAHLDIIRGDAIELIDVGVTSGASADIAMNFKGFIGDAKHNKGEDRGYIIRTDKDLIKRFSIAANGQRYQIVAEKKDKVLGQMFVDLRDPVLEYVVFQIGDGEKRCLYPGEKITCRPGQALKIIDIKTNVSKNNNVTAIFKGQGTSAEVPRSGVISLKKQGDYKVSFWRNRTPLGDISIQGL